MHSPESTIDAALLQRARSGDRQAHAALYRAYAPMVYTLAYRMLGSKASAEDVVQDSFVEVIRKARDFRGDSGIRSWIKRIAINIQDGDVILSISDRTPNSPEHAIRILSSFETGETVEFSLMRDGRRETVEYAVPGPTSQ